MDWVPIAFVTFKVAVFILGMSFAVKWHYDHDKTERNETGVPQSFSELRLFVAMMVVCGISVLGIVYAACWSEYSEGGSGGAIGCALIFLISLMSLVSKPTAGTGLSSHRGQASQEQSNRLAKPNPATLAEGSDQLTNLESQTERLRATFAARLASAEREKVYLGVAGFISALTWKFGHIPAAWLDFRS